MYFSPRGQRATTTIGMAITVSFLHFLLLSACIAYGQQTVNLGDNVSRPIPGAGHDYIHGLSETVNPSNGNLTIKIDLPVPKGRGLTIPFALTYNSGEVFPFSATTIAGCGGLDSTYCGSYPSAMAGWSNTFPRVAASYYRITLPPYDSYCDISSSYNFYDPEGGTHMLGLAAISQVGNPMYETASACGYITYSPTHCTQVVNGGTTGWYGGCSGGYTYDAVASGGDDEVLAESLLCNGLSSDTTCGTSTPPFTVTDAGGITYFFYGGAALPYPFQIEDRNGNILQESGQPGSSTLSITDTLGRQAIAINQGSSGIPSAYVIGGLQFTPTYTTAPANFTETVGSDYQQIDVPESGLNLACTAEFSVSGGGGDQLQVLGLPNGETLQFKYDSTWGLVNEIDYPDGGWVKYTWKLSDTMNQLATFNAKNNSGAFPPVAGACNYQYKTPVVATRTVGYSSGVTAQTQTFSYNTTWYPATNSGGGIPSYANVCPADGVPCGDRVWQSKSTTVTTTDNVTGKTSTTTYTYSYVFQPLQPDSKGQIAAELPVEQSVVYNDWSGNYLETVNKTWYDQFEMTSEQTVLNTGQSAKTTYSYFSGFPERVQEKDEYDYGQSSASRITTYGYYTFAVPNGAVLAKPNQVIVKDGSGNRYAETDVTYDGQAVHSVTGTLPQGTHDETNYGVNSSTLRGNPTSVTRWSSVGTSPATTYSFDATGQELSMTSPCGNSTCTDLRGTNFTTNYTYADAYTVLSAGANTPYTPSANTNALLTKITDPLGHTTQFTYDFNNSQLTSTTDENSQVAKYIYSDSLNRLTETDFPDSGQTTYHYNDSASSPSTTTYQLLCTSTKVPTCSASSVSKTTVAVRDGMGHVVQTQLTDPAGVVYTDLVYDGEGNLYKSSNPYRSTSDPTYGVTTSNYDALGRKIQVQHSDGTSYAYWCYNNVLSSPAVPNCSTQVGSVRKGSWVDINDENGNHWQQTSDAFGRLADVLEPDGVAMSRSPAIETDYQYDVLNNLKSVAQPGVSGRDASRGSRTFSYDSLSRLYSATNPESGTIGYVYDANGNVATRTDARGVVTSYTYDPLNRIVSKAYSQDSNKTPFSCYQYDASTTQNGIGRLSYAWTTSASGSCSSTVPSSGLLTLRSISSYDPMGRETGEQQCTPTRCSQSSGHSLSYLFDFAGDLVQQANTVGANNQPLTLNLTYDQVARPCLVTSSWSGSVPQNLFQANPAIGSNAGYTAFGTLQNWYLGSSSGAASSGCTSSPTSPINITQAFTKRLWLNTISATGQVP